jgi:cbb3-type cytochrome oxidase subunit 3
MLHTEMIPAWMMAALALLAILGMALALRRALRAPRAAATTGPTAARGTGSWAAPASRA